MNEGFKLFKVLPEGSGSAMSKVVKACRQELAAKKEAVRLVRKGYTDSQERDIIAAQVSDEIKVRLRTDRRFRQEWYKSKESSAGVVDQIVREKEEKLKEMGKLNHNGQRIIKGGLPAEWKSSESVL